MLQKYITKNVTKIYYQKCHKNILPKMSKKYITKIVRVFLAATDVYGLKGTSEGFPHYHHPHATFYYTSNDNYPLFVFKQ